MSKVSERAIAAAAYQSKNGPRFGYGLCLQRCRMCYDVDALEPDAASAWAHAKFRHTQTNPVKIPRGVPVFWTGGSSGHGHIAISTGDGWCWSTDIKRTGYFDKVPIADIHSQWGLTLVGWTEDINGVRVWDAPQPDPTRGPHVDAAIDELKKSKGRGKRWAAIQAALKSLLGIKSH